MNINKGWKRFMAVGCSHGMYADPKAIEGVLKFKERWRPHCTVHLGDFVDMTPFMSSARGKGDAVEPDIGGGLKFLDQLRPNVVLAGNHEVRLWREAASDDEVYSGYALRLINDITEHCRKRKALFIEYTGIWQAFQLANYKFTHGTVYGENAPRDMAEMYGNVIFAHTHKVGRMTGRRDDTPTGISVGTLTRRGAMDYANTRRATFAWSQGMAFGYYNDEQLIPWVHEQPQGQDEWILPV